MGNNMANEKFYKKAGVRMKVEEWVNGKMEIGREPVIFHSNFYNLFLQRAMLMNDNLGMDDVIINAAVEVTFAALNDIKSHENIEDPKMILRKASELFKMLGFGLINFSKINEEGGVVTIPISHYGYALKIANDNQSFSIHQNLFDRGFCQAALGAAFGKSINFYKSYSTKCYSFGNAFSEIKLEVNRDDEEYFVQQNIGIDESDSDIPDFLTGDINREKIMEAFYQYDFLGDEDGLIPRFNLFWVRQFSNYYNRITYEFYHRCKEDRTCNNIENMLIEIACKASFCTMGEVLKSDEWYTVFKPMIKSREDILFCSIQLINALGWGKWRIVEMIPNQKLVVRIYKGYESVGYNEIYGLAKDKIDFFAVGVAKTLMELTYRFDTNQHMKINEKLYNMMISGDELFGAVQTKCEAMGDEYSEIVVERKEDK